MNLLGVTRLRLVVGVVGLAGLISSAGCGGSSATSEESGTTEPPASSQSGPNRCPNPEGQACLGTVDAGSYTTSMFTPQLTYTVPEGWSNFEDMPGNFLLVPPGATLPGVDKGTSDYIGVYTSVAAMKTSCTVSALAPGVPATPTGIASWIKAQPGLRSTDPVPVKIGGLQGVVLDVTEVKGAGMKCAGLPGGEYVALIIGQGPSGLEHGVIPGLGIRLYLLTYGDGTLAIEVDDVAGGGSRFSEYSDLVKRFRFAAA